MCCTVGPTGRPRLGVQRRGGGRGASDKSDYVRTYVKKSKVIPVLVYR
jgi:hypothetical protein